MHRDTILVTGASSSIGCEIIRQISTKDSVILAHFNSSADRISALQKEVQAKIVPIQADFSRQDDVNAFIDAIESASNFPNKIVLLAAPRLTLTRFKDLTLNDFKHQLEIQLYPAFSILNHFLPKMAQDKYGKVVFVLSSYTTAIPPAAMAHYVTAKYALLGLMKSLASEYASKQVCINAVSPSMIETGFLNNIPDKIVQFAAQQHPLKRNAVPTDIAPTVKFLLSNDSDYMTGINIPITGGS